MAPERARAATPAADGPDGLKKKAKRPPGTKRARKRARTDREGGAPADTRPKKKAQRRGAKRSRKRARAGSEGGGPAAARPTSKARRRAAKRARPGAAKAPPEAVGPRAQDADARLALFDQIGAYAPYLGVTSHDGGAFVVSASDRGVGRGLFAKRGRPEFRVLTRAVTAVEALIGEDAIAGRIFVDVGANIGTETVSALLSHRFGSAICCEPEEENYRLLRANLALNGLDERVRPLRVAVSNRVGRSKLVVTDGKAGLSWVAVDREKIRDAEASRAERAAEDPALELPAMTVVDVELVTLDRLAESGVIDADVGMVWIDAEGHEGHVLQGAATVADRGVPVVFEFHPGTMDERGDRGKIQEVAEQCYTHFVDLRRQEADRTEPRFRLRSVTELREHAERFLDPSSPPFFTDLLLLKLDAEQASVGADLPELMASRRPAPGAEPGEDDEELAPTSSGKETRREGPRRNKQARRRAKKGGTAQPKARRRSPSEG